MHFDHERIPERVVHARGYGVHGVFVGYGSAEKVCRAAFLGNGVETPVFVRFSTVVGSRGSADTVRDTRGFATKFYTQEGNFDLVGNNIPVFFIQDGIKFPDIIHAAKPHPDREIPQAQSAHDTFWDFVSTHTEATHHVMWQMSDRAIPRSYRTMEGFGVHTFRLVNAAGETSLAKFHWKPKLSVGFILVLTPIISAAASALPADQVGVGLGILQGAQFLGAGTGPALFGVLLTARQQSGSGAVNPLYPGHDGAAFSDAFLAMAVIVAGTLLVSSRMRSR